MKSARPQPRHARETALTRPRMSAVSLVILAIGTMLALVLPASPGSAADYKYSGTLTKSKTRAAHSITAPEGTLAATLSFTGTTGLTASLTLVDSHGRVVTRDYGTSPV